MRIQKSTDKEDFGRKGLFRADSFFVFTIIFVKAQDFNCVVLNPFDTTDIQGLPWYGYNEYLDSLADVWGYNDPIPQYSVGQSNVEGGFDGFAEVWIPVKAWVYHNNNGSGGITEAEVEESIRELNDRFNGTFDDQGQASNHTKIQFYLLCDIGNINNSNLLNPDNQDVIKDQIFSNRENNCVNIHYVSSLPGNAMGLADMPSKPFERSMVVETSNGSHLNSTMGHEMGHVLGLFHTFHAGTLSYFVNYNKNTRSCRQEYVSRTKNNAPWPVCYYGNKRKCSVNGDFLCGTEADPHPHTGSNFGDIMPNPTGGGLIYDGNETDHDDEIWAPNVHNYMTYIEPQHMVYFAVHQMIAMRSFAEGTHSETNFNSPINFQNEFIDIYEPDNVIGSAQELKFGIPQHRGLHAVKTGNPSNPSSWQCDVDWVYFEVPFGMKVNIFTEPVPGNQQVGSTQIFLIDQDGTTFIGYNNNKSSSSTYSEISNITLSEGTYWLRIENNSSTAGEYYLNLEQCGEECCYNSLIGSISDINSSTGTFNEGVEDLNFNEKFFGSSVTIVGANFGCNTNAPLGFGGGNSPLSNSTLDLTICQEAQINVLTGAFILGDADNDRIANVTFDEGTSLILHDKLIVEEGSKLTIEDGANLAFFETATIELQGPNSILEIRGKVTVGDNAIFTFSGDGRIIIDQFIYKGVRDNFWDIGEDAKLILEGPTDYGQVLLECKSNFSPVMEDNHTFAEVKIHKGQVLLHPGKHASITSPAFINKVEFNLPSGISTSDRHGGLKIWGRYNDVSYIHYNRFLNGNFGIKANQSISNPQPLVLHGNHFESNYHGLYIIGQSFTAQASTFKYNAYGLYGTDLHGTGLVNNCDFEENTVGCFLSGQGGSETQIAHSVFDATQMMASYSNPVGLQLEDYSVSLNCNNFSNLYYGIEFFGVNVSIDLSEDKRNRFFEAKNAIYGNITNGYFNMLAGNNGFFNNTSHDVWISASNNLSGPLNGNQIDFSENTMAQVFQWGWINVAAPNIGGAYTPTTNGSHPFNHCEGSILEYPSINEVMEVQMFTSNTYVNLPGGGGGNLIDVTVMAGEQITNSNDPNEILDDYKAFEDLTDISNELINQFSTLSATDKHVFFLILRMMEKALHQIYKQELLPYNDDYFESAAQEILDFNDIIDQLLGLLGTPSDTVEYERATALKLQTVHNFRQGGYLQDAVNTLFNYEPIHVGEKTLDRWLYWDCICNVEAEFMQGIIDEEVFDQDLMTCITSYAPRMFKMFEDPDVPLENNKTFSLKTYPNPTSEFLYFQTPGINDPETNLDIHLYSINGVEVYNNQAEASFVQRIDVKHLPPGNYVLKVVADGQIKTKKVIIQ